MANRNKPQYPPPGPAHPERMRDPDYVVRGYKAALFNRTTSHDRQRSDSWLTAWLEDISDDDRQRARAAALDGPPHDTTAARAAGEAKDEKRIRECAEDAKPKDGAERKKETLQDHRDGPS